MTFQVKTELMFCPPEHIHTNTTLSQPSTTDASSSSMLDEELFGKADDRFQRTCPQLSPYLESENEIIFAHLAYKVAKQVRFLLWNYRNIIL